MEGLRTAHVRDGVALCHYFAWLEDLIEGGGAVSEADAAEKALHFRQQQAVSSRDGAAGGSASCS